MSSSADQSPPLRRNEMVQWFSRVERTENQRIGTEVENFILAHGAEGLYPVRYQDHVRPLLDYLVNHFGWQPGQDSGSQGELVSLERSNASITLEPGGQFELSGKPLGTIHETCNEFSQHYRELHQAGTALDLTFLATGFHPFARRDEVSWMPKDRYAIMRNYLPTRSSHGLDMMLRTATVQANLDFASEQQCGFRFRLALATSSLFSAIFANSPYVEGKSSGYRSFRSRVWSFVDPSRCGLPEFMFDGSTFSYERYVDWALDVPMFFVKRKNAYNPHHATFRQFMNDGFTAPDGTHHRASLDDWTLHLSTLFPEVRLKPFIEIRGADAVPSRYLCAMPALCKGILYDEQSSLAAWDIVKDLSYAERLDLWQTAREHGCSSREIQSLCQQLLTFAKEGLDRISKTAANDLDESRYLAPLDELIEGGKSPADAALGTIGEQPGLCPRGKAELARSFYVAGRPPCSKTPAQADLPCDAYEPA